MDPEPIVLPDGQMQHGRMRRQRVMKELRRGRPLSADDLPVAAALVDQQKARQKWIVPLWILLPISCLFSGLNDHGIMRWIWFGLIPFLVVAVLVQLREQRQLIRNFEQQKTPNPGDHRDDDAS